MSQTSGPPVFSKPSEADTCRKHVTPKLQAAGWDTEPHSLAEQRTFTPGRIVVAGTKAKRQEEKRADYLLRYTPDFTIAVVAVWMLRYRPESDEGWSSHRLSLP
jgi:type I restriction enzyme R subunit